MNTVAEDTNIKADQAFVDIEANKAELAANPQGFWFKMHEATIQTVDDWIAKGKDQFEKGYDFYQATLRTVVVEQSKELVIFRTLEAFVRSGKLDEELLGKVIADLDTLRMAQAKSAQVATTMAASSKSNGSNVG